MKGFKNLSPKITRFITTYYLQDAWIQFIASIKENQRIINIHEL